MLAPDIVEVAPTIAAPLFPIVAACTSGEVIKVPAFNVVTDSCVAFIVVAFKVPAFIIEAVAVPVVEIKPVVVTVAPIIAAPALPIVPALIATPV